MRKIPILLAACAVVLFSAGMASASDGSPLAWGNFTIRLINILIVIGIIWYAAGGFIKKFFVGRRTGIVQEMDDVARLKKEAAAHLVDIERRVAGMEAECAALLREGRVQAENLKAAILADAESQAAQIVAQARRSAEQEGKAEQEAIRVRMANEIVAAMEKGLAERLDTSVQQKLIDKSLTKVVLQ